MYLVILCIDVLRCKGSHMETALPVACCTPLAAPRISQNEVEATAALFKALADPHRVRIVNLLANADGAVCVCEITPVLGLSADHVLPPEETSGGRTDHPRAARH